MGTWYRMKKNRTLDKNQMVVAGLFFVCVILVFIIFFVSNRTVPGENNISSCVTRADVEAAFDFLHQEEAVQTVLSDVASDEVVTYGDYRQFLQQLHLWDAGNFDRLVDWDACKEEGLSFDVLEESRDTVAELFEMPVALKDHREEPVVTEPLSAMPQIDENTTVRVLLLQNGSPVAKDIRFSANAKYSISWDAKTRQKKKNQVIRAAQLKLAVGQTAVVRSKNGELYLADKEGRRDTLGYSGNFQITRYEDGYALVNEVKIEDYLYGVVQSEMPAYFEEEALKAQAVCARTYIVNQLMQENYPQYRADVDDSVRFQAYNQAAPDERVVEAVDATKGQILVKDGQPINAYFFSTSHGETSGTEIWDLASFDYLQPVRGNGDAELLELSDEETFRAYIRECDPDDYDAQSAYYRWKATLDISSHLSEIKSLLQGIDESQTDCVIIRNSNGQETTAAAMDDWEEALQLKVLERSSSGAVLRLLIVFSGGEVELSNENYIRQVLGIWMNLLQDQDGNAVKTGEMLPSVYFYVQPIKEGIVLFGGGMGHGIGMSQYGANGYAKQGADLEDILNLYYQDVELKQIYSVSES